LTDSADHMNNDTPDNGGSMFKPRCEGCGIGAGWTRLIRIKHRNRNAAVLCVRCTERVSRGQ